MLAMVTDTRTVVFIPAIFWLEFPPPQKKLKIPHSAAKVRDLSRLFTRGDEIQIYNANII